MKVKTIELKIIGSMEAMLNTKYVCLAEEKYNFSQDGSSQHTVDMKSMKNIQITRFSKLMKGLNFTNTHSVTI